MVTYYALRCGLLVLAAVGFSLLIRRKHYALAVVLSIGLSAFSLPVFSDLMLLLGSLALAGVCVLSAVVRVSATTALILGIAAVTVTTGSYVRSSFNERNDLLALRATYPVQSLSERLEYERERVAESGPVPVLSAAQEESLARWEDDFRHNRRASMLERLHDDVYLQFVSLPGFGLTRMGRLHPDLLELPVPQRLEVVPKDECMRTGMETAAPPANETLQSLVWQGHDDFLDSDRMGSTRDRDHVVGFQPHRFDERPQPVERWRIVQLELVSLLKHDQPSAYSSEELPDMEHLDEAPVRDLDSFESQALARLRADEDVVIDSSETEIRMLGSLRASSGCLSCHYVERGELLGALSYALRPVSQAPHAEDEPPLEWGVR
jgi:hypothetical protein